MIRKSLVLALVLLAVGGLVAGVFGAQPSPGWTLSWVGYPIVGGLILWTRHHNPIGWVLLAIGAAWAFDSLLFTSLDRISPAYSVWVEMAASPLIYSAWLLMVTIPVLFPVGRPVDRMTRSLLRLVVVVLAMVVIADLVSSEPRETTGTAGPWAIPELDGLSRFVLNEGFFLLPLLLALALGSMVARWRRSSGVERLQYRWLLIAVGFVAVGLSLTMIVPERWFYVVEVSVPLFLNMIPVAIGVAVLRHGLYDLDLVINRTVLFVLLGGFITMVYTLVVVGVGTVIGSENDIVLSIAATALVAFVFQPARQQAQRWANRIAYGERATPYEVLSDLTQRLANAESTQGLLDLTARRVAMGTAAERAAVWAIEDGLLRPVGWWPPEAEFSPVEILEDLPGYVTIIGTPEEPLGALTVDKRRGNPITPTEERLLEDLAGSSTSVLRHLALQDELRRLADDLDASRRRLVEVQDLERRRMERQLDEGAQQLVVSLKVKLDMGARLARTDGAERLAELLEAMSEDARQAINQIRSLARGLYPTVLAEGGLVVALRSMAEQAPVSVEIAAVDVGDVPPDVAASVFFCISEAITNAAKHAGGEPVRVELTRDDSALRFEVRDDGPGFDHDRAGSGSGLRNMADRIEAVGGRLEIHSAPGRGTVIEGEVPLPGPLPHSTESLVPAFG